MPTDERVEKVARELFEIDGQIMHGIAPRSWVKSWDEVREVYRARAARVLRVADALTPEPKPIGYIVIATDANQGDSVCDILSYLYAADDEEGAREDAAFHTHLRAGLTYSVHPVMPALRAPRVPDTSGRYIVDGTTYLRASGDTLEEAVERWQELANGGYPDGWEDTEEGEEGLIVGGCESCGRPILDGERYAVDDDLVYECSECWEPTIPDEAVGGLMEGIER